MRPRSITIVTSLRSDLYLDLYEFTVMSFLVREKKSHFDTVLQLF